MSELRGAPLRPVHDRPTVISFIQISLFAFFLYGFGATQALLRDEQGTSRTVSGLHATFFAIANVIGALVTPRAIDRFGRSMVLRYSVIGLCLGLAVYTSPFGLAASLTGISMMAGFGAAMIVTSNAFFLDYQKGAGPAALTEANAVAAFFGFLGPLAIGIGAATVLGWRAGLWVLILALIVTEILRSRYAAVYGAPRSVQRREAHHGRLPGSFYWSLGLMAMFMASEFTLTLWSADLLRDRAGLGPAAAAASVAAITGGMLAGRTVGSRLAERFPIDGLLKVSMVVALGGFAIAWLTTTAVVLIVGLFVTGVGIALNWPLGVSRAVAASGGLTDTASGLAAAAGGAAAGVAPFILGALSDQSTVHTAFLIVPVLFLGALGILFLSPVRPAAVTAR